MSSSETSLVSKSYEDDSSKTNLTEERTNNLDEDTISDQVPTFVIHEKSPIETSSSKLLGSHDSEIEDQRPNLNQQGEVLINGEVEAAESTKKTVVAKKVEKKGSAVGIIHGKFNFGQKNQESSPRKVNLTNSDPLRLLIKHIFFAGSDFLAQGYVELG